MTNGADLLKKARSAHTVYRELGFSTVRIDHLNKGPNEKDWQKRAPHEATEGKTNIGLLLGGKRNLVDIDLDCPEAVACAPILLPPTPMKHGRSTGIAHYWYYATEHKYIKLKDPAATPNVIVELRGTDGLQTLVPPSYHPSGEKLEWNTSSREALTPARVQIQALETAVKQIAGVVLLARSWEDGQRHEMAVSFAGAMCRTGISAETATKLMQAVCFAAGDDEFVNRLEAVNSTYEKHANGITNYTGMRTLAELIGDKNRASDIAGLLGIEWGRGPVPRTEQYVEVKRNGIIDEAALDEAARLIQGRKIWTLEEVAATQERITWLWDKHIPNGHLTMIAAPQRTFKSYVAGALERCVINGDPWPDGQEPDWEQCGYVLHVEGEGMHAALAERHEAMGTDRSAIRFPPIGDSGDADINLSDDTHMQAVMGMLRDPEIKLCVIDSLTGCFPGLKENSNEEMTLAMGRLRQLAARSKKAVLVVHHFNKYKQEGSGALLARVRGADAITQLCRSVWLLEKRGDVVVAVQDKNTFAKDQNPWAAKIEESGDVVWVMDIPETQERKEADPTENMRAIRSKIVATLEANGGSMRSNELQAKIVEEMGLTNNAYREATDFAKSTLHIKFVPVKTLSGEVDYWTVELTDHAVTNTQL